MFRITAQYDDRHHPLNGDVITVASVAEALAVLADAEHEDGGDIGPEDLADIGGRLHCYGFQVEYTVERI